MTADEIAKAALPILHNERLASAVGRLVMVFRYEQHDTPGSARTKAEKLAHQLRQAKRVLDDMTPANRIQIDPDGHALNALLANTAAFLERFDDEADATPYPRKVKQENLYHAMEWDYLLATRKRPAAGRDDVPTEFGKFMALTVCMIEGDSPEDWEKHTAKVIRHWKRLPEHCTEHLWDKLP